MRKSLLLTILVLLAMGCSEPDTRVQANFLIDWGAWNLEPNELRSADVSWNGDVKFFRNIRSETFEISLDLPCVGDLLARVTVYSEASEKAGRVVLDGFACSESLQTVSEWDTIYPKGWGEGICINPDNWLGDC